jgi:SOS-response transcriptional repressor LexA
VVPDGENAYMDIDTLKRLMVEHGETQAELARMLGITPDKFSKTLKGTRQLKLDEARKLASYFGVNSNLEVQPALIPIIGLVSAGAWREAIEHARGWMPSPSKALSEDAFAVEVEGDSMDLIAKEGEAIIIDPRDKELRAGRYYIIRNEEGETTFKRYMENPARFEPCSSNPAHKEIVLGRESFSVVGRAVKKVADL